jgi:hypothetical protein
LKIENNIDVKTNTINIKTKRISLKIVKKAVVPAFACLHLANCWPLKSVFT